MPHVNIRLYPGRTDEQKRDVTERILAAFKDAMGINPKWLSVAFEEIEPDDWDTQVVEPEIRAKADLLYKEPGYLED